MPPGSARRGGISSVFVALMVTLVALLIAAPFVLSAWGLSQLGFMAVYIVAGGGLMLLAGVAGQLSLCHAAFIGVGAYGEAILLHHGWPLALALPAAVLLAMLAGALAAGPVRHLAGVYFAIATLATGFVMQEIFARWESVTGGNAGLAVPALAGDTLYALAMGAAGLTLWLLGRLRDSRLGRAWRVLRDDPLAAAALGMPLAQLKLLAATWSAGLAGLAGALYAHQIRFVSPEQFGVVMSVELLMMLVVGGLASRTGLVIGAIFLIALPQAIAGLAAALPWPLPPAGLELFTFGLVLVLTLRFAPGGLASLALPIIRRLLEKR